MAVYVLAFGFSQVRGLNVESEIAEPQIVLQREQVCNVYSIAYSPDGKYIAAGYSTNEIRIWDAKSGVLVRTLNGHKDIV